MNKLRLLLVAFVAFFLTSENLSAQADPYGNPRPNNNTFYRNKQRCSEPLSAKSFARDYPGLCNTTRFHLEKELKEYVKYRCITSDQIRRLALLFPTDREKYDYLTFAFPYVFDIENYALAGSILANRNARDGFYRFLVQEGIPAGDYFNNYQQPYYGGYAYNGAYPPPQTPQYQQPYGQNYQPNGQPYGQSYSQPNGNYGQPNANYNQPNGNYGQTNGQTPPNGAYNNYPDPRDPNQQQSYGQNNGQNYNPNNPNVNAGYGGGLNYREFEGLKERVKQNTFDTGKLSEAKRLTGENSLTANQVAEITRLFTFDNNRLEYAKFAYEHTNDRQNFSIVVEALAFAATRRDLQNYLNGKH